MKVDTQTTSSSEPNATAMAAPVTETPVMETPVTETPVTETPAARSDTPAPMETGGVGDGQSWAECVKAGIDEEFQQDRPVKRHRSQSRRHKQRPMLPFPLQDSEGRLASISQLYEHVGEQPATCHNVAGRGFMHLHPEMLPGKAMCLRNQIACMIAALLPPIKNYVPGIAFEGTRDVRVMD